MYTAEEMGDNAKATQAVAVAPKAPAKLNETGVDTFKAKLEACKSLVELKTVWSAIPAQAKTALTALKDNLKTTLK